MSYAEQSKRSSAVSAQGAAEREGRQVSAQGAAELEGRQVSAQRYCAEGGEG